MRPRRMWYLCYFNYRENIKSGYLGAYPHKILFIRSTAVLVFERPSKTCGRGFKC